MLVLVAFGEIGFTNQTIGTIDRNLLPQCLTSASAVYFAEITYIDF